MASAPHLIVGLGNPGDDYNNTRHNIGFMAADAIAVRYGAGAWKKKFKGNIQLASVPGHANTLLLKPDTFMNLSGESVLEAMNFYKLAPKDVIVFHDDLDLLPGQVKIKQAGGTGGHNGLKSLDAHIGLNYWRVRIGIGHPGEKGDVVTNYVLGAFAKADKAWVAPLLDALVENLPLLLNGNRDEYLKALTEK